MADAVEDDLSLPRAAVNKMIKEMIPMIRVSNDARELVLNCCTEFIHLIASEANEICNKQTKKTISPEHVIQALESLGFQDYVKDVEGVYQQFKKQAQTRKKNSKMKNQGVSEEELLRQQQALIAKARAEQAHEEWMQMQQHNLPASQQPMTSMQPNTLTPVNINATDAQVPPPPTATATFTVPVVPGAVPPDPNTLINNLTQSIELQPGPTTLINSVTQIIEEKPGPTSNNSSSDETTEELGEDKVCIPMETEEETYDNLENT